MRALSYAIPNSWPQVEVGMLVRIPLRNRTELGVVEKVPSEGNVPRARLRYAKELLYNAPVLTPDLLRLGRWIEHYYAAGTETVFEAMIPAAVRQGSTIKTRTLLKLGKGVLTKSATDKPQQAPLPTDANEVTATPTPQAETQPTAQAETQPLRTVGSQPTAQASPQPAPLEKILEKIERRAPKQAVLLRHLAKLGKAVPKIETLEALGVGAASCAALVKAGLVTEIAERVEREAYADELAHGERVVTHIPVLLNPEQQAAADAIGASLQTGAFVTHLLHGVTGSGKTEVYLDAMRRVLDAGGSVIFLVPEVALTPQTVARLRQRLACISTTKVVVWHSHLSAGERFDGWLALARGEAKVVVGARSAIFAPVSDLRLVIVDEEHEPAYKQSEVPRYHGRDVAVYRAMLANAVCVLGSATPSLESLYNVQQGRYHVNRLLARVDDRQLPLIHVVDMTRQKRRPGALGLISQPLADKLYDRFEKKEQSILFLNRRGYSSSLLCGECSHVPMCPHCDLTLTYHRSDERLKCHICGYGQAAPKACPSCHAPTLRGQGSGTQRIEDAVMQLIPRARVVRMDTDTMSRKNRFREILNDFRVGKIDILVGTQMIAKGLDFPNVTLVSLIDADIALHVPDFRAGERCFQLLVQVSGRAGRGDKAGEVIVQTYMPHSAPIQFARRSDFDGFLEEELEHRREYHYPPFRHLIRHLFRGRNAEKVSFYAEKWADLLLEKLGDKIEVRGPAPAPLEKMKDTYRFHIWYFVSKVSQIVPQIVHLRETFPMDPDVIDVLDVDPVDML